MSFMASSSRHRKYDVFLSFKGSDTRDNFTSHLYAALDRKAIHTFIDSDLERGEEIMPALLRTIEEVKVAIIIFSEGYADSPWCLDEVVKIIECHETRGLMVVPVFYRVNPSDVCEPGGIFAKAIAKHENCSSMEFERVQSWKLALRKAANLAGWDSLVVRPESKLVEEIVNYIWRKLKQIPRNCSDGLVGIGSRIVQIKQLLSIRPFEVHVLGIWGMGGVGKTTLAEAAFNEISAQFAGHCFLSNVRARSEESGGLIRLAEELLSETLEERDLKLYTSIKCSAFKDMLHGRKVLLVLDDVSNSEQLEFLVGDRSWFGPGSRIIITSRDKEVLGKVVDSIYEMKELDSDEALQLFSWNAFKQNHPKEEYMELSHLVLRYAKGAPLALKVLGSFLNGKNRREWESTLQKLEKGPTEDIQNVLKTSYDDLDEEEKEIFLHIACFFRGEEIEGVIQVLDECGLSTIIGLSVLVDKSLVLILDTRVEMHDLLQEMGRKIVRQESKNPGKRSRLWDHEDIRQVFLKENGTDAIEGIFLDISKAKELDLSLNAFDKMPNLKLLKLYTSNDADNLEEDCKVDCSSGLDYLPNEMRYLEWHKYPLKSLPRNFEPMNLVKLKLRYSNLKRLWKGVKFLWSQHLEKLKEMNLSDSKHLVKIPELSQASNLESLHLDRCVRLRKIPSSSSHLSRLTTVSMRDCLSIRSLPNTIDLPCLGSLVLKGCSNLERFPQVSRNISELILDGTTIKAVPTSVECLRRLSEFSMANCTKLEGLPSSICKLKSLEILYLDGCSRLHDFPEILERMDSLWALSLSRTAIKMLPSSIDNLQALGVLELNDCKKLASLPESLCNLTALYRLDLSNCSKLQRLPKNINNLKSLEKLDIIGCEGQEFLGLSLPSLSGLSLLFSVHLSGCKLRKLPDDWSCLSSLVELDLSNNNFFRLPPSIKHLPQLKILNVSYCKKLQTLPDLPPHLQDIDARDCISLKTVFGLKELLESEDFDPYGFYVFTFSNCFNLDQDAWSNALSCAWLRIQKVAAKQQAELELDHQVLLPRLPFGMCYPGNKTPGWFTYQRMGNSITVRLPPNSEKLKFLGCALCTVVEFQGGHHRCNHRIAFEFHFKSNNCSDHTKVDLSGIGDTEVNNLECGGSSKHVFLWYDLSLRRMAERCSSVCDGCGNIEASFEFFPVERCGNYFNRAECCKVKECGVLLLYGRDRECYNLLETGVELVTRKRKNPFAAEGASKRATDRILQEKMVI